MVGGVAKIGGPLGPPCGRRPTPRVSWPRQEEQSRRRPIRRGRHQPKNCIANCADAQFARFRLDYGAARISADQTTIPSFLSLGVNGGSFPLRMFGTGARPYCGVGHASDADLAQTHGETSRKSLTPVIRLPRPRQGCMKGRWAKPPRGAG